MTVLMLAFLLLVFGLVVYGLTQYRGGEAKSAKETKEKFKAEEIDTDAEIEEVADAFREARGSPPSAGEVRRAIKAMRKTGQSAEDAVNDIVNRQKISPPHSNPQEEPKPQPQPQKEPELKPWQKPSTAPPQKTSPDPCLDASILRRVEDELESVVTRIDGLLEEIQLMKSRVVSGPLTDGSVASYVPYHPV